MLKMKSTKISTLLIVVGLMSLPLILAACGTASDTAEAPFGLRTVESYTPVDETDVGDASEIVRPSIDEPADTAAEERAQETETNAATAGANNVNKQSRIADRSEHIFDPTTATEPSAIEIEGLTYMREEEKLARDVYLALYDQWGLPVFQNISGSEQAHMDSVLMLLEQYGLDDPAAGKDVGEFSNTYFQSLYEQLVGQGGLTLADALTVGATIEELDIVDLEERLAQTDNEYIVQVYRNLLAGSENHLRAFVSNLERQTGEAYQPPYLDQDAFQAIINDAPVRGGGNEGNGSGNGRGGYGSNGNGRQNGQGRNA